MVTVDKVKESIKKHGKVLAGAAVVTGGTIIWILATKYNNNRVNMGLDGIHGIGLVKYFNLDGEELNSAEMSNYLDTHKNEIIKRLRQ